MLTRLILAMNVIFFMSLISGNVGAAEQLVTSANRPLSQTAIAGLGATGSVVVWTADDEVSGLDIYARRYGAAGTSLGNAFRVNTYTDSWQSNPAVASLSGGGFVIVWQSSGQDGSQWGIFGQRYLDNGTPVGDEFQINSNWSFNQSNPNVVGLAGGGFVVAWQSPDENNSWTDEIFVRIYNIAGQPLTGEVQANTITSGLNTIFGPSDSQMNPAIAAISDGGFVVVWDSYKEYDGFNVNKGIAGRQFNSQGIPLGEHEFMINTTTSGNQELPAVAPRGSGGFLVTWYAPDPGGSGELEIYAQRFDSGGIKAGPEFRVNSYSTDNQIWPEAVLLTTGENLVAWYSNWQDGDSGGIYARRINDDGTFAGPEFRVNSMTGGYQHDHGLGVLPQGGWLASWSSSLNGGTSYTVSIDIPPLITTFTLPAQSDLLQVAVNLTTSNDADIADWCLAESSTPAACIWSDIKPVSYTFGGPGARTLHAFARDIRGNIGAASASTFIVPQRWTLSVLLSGTGEGNVNSDSGRLTCPGTCSADYEAGTSVLLTQAPNSSSLFSGWSGPCTVTNGHCLVTIDAAKSITATFNLVPQIKLELTALSGYDNLISAYTYASGTIYSLDTLLAGDWILGGGKAITWKGGYTSDYMARTGYTTLRGNLNIRSGSLRVDRVRIR